MTTSDLHDNLSADPADDLMVRFTDVLEALTALRDTALDVQCPGCDPDGARTEWVRVQVKERYSLVLGDADFMLTCAANAREALRGVVASPPDLED